MSHKRDKVIINCTKYPQGINFETHRVIAGQVTEAAIDDLVILKTAIEARDNENQAGWDAYTAKHYNFSQSDDDDD